MSVADKGIGKGLFPFILALTLFDLYWEIRKIILTPAATSLMKAGRNIAKWEGQF